MASDRFEEWAGETLVQLLALGASEKSVEAVRQERRDALAAAARELCEEEAKIPTVIRVRDDLEPDELRQMAESLRDQYRGQLLIVPDLNYNEAFEKGKRAGWDAAIEAADGWFARFYGHQQIRARVILCDWLRENYPGVKEEK